jgi:dUTP pyrophosphatase
MITTLIKFLTSIPLMPSRRTEGSTGYDIYSSESVVIKPGEVIAVPTGISVQVPQGFDLQVRVRSSLASKGIILANGVGTIDSDYTGEIKVLLANIGKKKYTINKLDRVAQLVLIKHEYIDFKIDTLKETDRGSGGFGSTGK